MILEEFRAWLRREHERARAGALTLPHGQNAWWTRCHVFGEVLDMAHQVDATQAGGAGPDVLTEAELR